MRLGAYTVLGRSDYYPSFREPAPAPPAKKTCNYDHKIGRDGRCNWCGKVVDYWQHRHYYQL